MAPPVAVQLTSGGAASVVGSGAAAGSPVRPRSELVGERRELFPALLANLRPQVTGAYWKATQML